MIVVELPLLWTAGPIIQGKAGNWYPTDLEGHDFRGFTGYKVGPHFEAPRHSYSMHISLFMGYIQQTAQTTADASNMRAYIHPYIHTQIHTYIHTDIHT